MNNRKYLISLLILTLFFGAVIFWLAIPGPRPPGVSPRFDWPDETANYFWISRWAQNGELAVPEPLNLAAQNQIHPRSFNVRSDGAIVPGSFLGLILFYGFLAKIFGSGAIVYFTPVLSLLAVLAFFGLIKRLFDAKTAFWAAVLLLINPAWWYYTEFSLLPNVAFCSLVMIGAYGFLRSEKIRYFDCLFAGAAAGLALSIRPAEIIWLLAVFLVVFYYGRARLKIRHLALFFTAAVLLLWPTLYQQQIIFGNYLTSGYSQLQSAAGACPACETVRALVLPFGFHPILASKNIFHYFILPAWWLTLLAGGGFLWVIFSPQKIFRRLAGYLGMTIFSGVWLGFYYGSWQFADLQTLSLNTLGASYVRYWLPLTVLATPLAAAALLWLTNFLSGRLSVIFRSSLVLVLFFLSAQLVLWGRADSWLLVKARIATYQQTAALVNGQTEVNAVIVTVRKDKVFFPERKVIHSFVGLPQNPELLTLLPNLVAKAPVYYYALAPQSELALGDNLWLEPVLTNGAEVLYKIKSSL